MPMKQELLLSPAVVGLGDVGQALEVAEVVSVVVVMGVWSWWWSWVFGRGGSGSCFSVVVVC